MEWFHKFNKEIKIVLAAASLGWGIYQFIEVEIGNGIFFTLLAGLIVLLIFKNEHILLTFWYLRKGNMEKSDKTLDRIHYPEKLIKSQEAYYYYLRGLTNSQRNLNVAEKFFKKALKTGLKGKQDQAIAKLNLAGTAASRRRKKEAQRLLSEAKKLDKHGMLDEQIKMMKMQMKKI